MVTELTVREAGPGRFDALVDGLVLLTSAQPLCDSARILIAKGCNPDSFLIMRRDGRKNWDLRATLKVAAALTVSANDTTFRQWRPMPADLRGRISDNGSSLVHLNASGAGQVSRSRE